MQPAQGSKHAQQKRVRIVDRLQQIDVLCSRAPLSALLSMLLEQAVTRIWLAASCDWKCMHSRLSLTGN